MDENKRKPKTQVIAIRLSEKVLETVELMAFVEKRTRTNMLRCLIEDAVDVRRETLEAECPDEKKTPR